MNLTREQVKALFEAMFGWIDYDQGIATPKSPHVITHFQAIFGTGKQSWLSSYDLDTACQKEYKKGVYKNHREKCIKFAEYFEEVVRILKEQP